MVRNTLFWGPWPMDYIGPQGSGLKIQGSRLQDGKFGALGLHCFTLGAHLAKNSIFGLQVERGFGPRAPRQKFHGSRAPKTPPPPPLWDLVRTRPAAILKDHACMGDTYAPLPREENRGIGVHTNSLYSNPS